MLRKILLGFAIATVIILLLVWLATGGLRDIARVAGNLNPASLVMLKPDQFRLPWQPEGFGSYRIDPVDGNGSSGGSTPEEELSDSEKEYENILRQMEDAKTFGEPSPYRGQVRITSVSGEESSPIAEYVEIGAQNATGPIKVSGWSLQSALTGIRAHIPRGANSFVLGAVNTQEDMYLTPGAYAIVVSGPSPLGTSFRENMCTGYLDGMQKFVPSLSRNCPASSQILPFTPDNLKTYGDTCFDFVQTIPPCTFPMKVPEVSPACRIFLANNLSYNGCVQNFRHSSNFARDSWRIYLNAGGELWRNTHDIVRLLDAEGKTVDVISY